jgi:hypothetical protein
MGHRFTHLAQSWAGWVDHIGRVVAATWREALAVCHEKSTPHQTTN